MKKFFLEIILTMLFMIIATNTYSQELQCVMCSNAGGGEYGYWGYEDKLSGKMIIPCKYVCAKDFSEGLAAVKISYLYWGYIDKLDNLVIPYKYERAGDFIDGLAAVRLNGKWGFIDKTGTEVVSCIYKRSELSSVAEELERERKATQERERLNQKINNIVTSNTYDVILQRNETEIKAKIIVENLSEIQYKMFDYLDGPTKTVAKSDVYVIIYANGTREYFDKFTETNASSAKKQTPTNCVNSTAFGLDIGIGGAEVKEIFSTALGIRVLHHFNPYFGIDFLKINWLTDYEVEGIGAGAWAMKLQIMPGVRVNSPAFFKCMSVYTAFRLGYGMLVGCDRTTSAMIGKSTNFEGLCLETELGFNLTRTTFVGFSYNYHKYFGSFLGRNHTLAVRFGFNFGN